LDPAFAACLLPAAETLKVNPELAGRLQKRFSFLDFAPPAGRLKNNGVMRQHRAPGACSQQDPELGFSRVHAG
jgi:hypothetical protein